MKVIKSKLGSQWCVLSMAGLACLFAAGCSGGSSSERAGAGVPAYSVPKAGTLAGTVPMNTSVTPPSGGTASIPGTTAMGGATATGGMSALGGATVAGGTTGTAGIGAVGGALLTGGTNMGGNGTGIYGGTTSMGTTPSSSAPDGGVPDAGHPDSADSSVSEKTDAAVDTPVWTDTVSGEIGATGGCGTSNWNLAFDVTSITGAMFDQDGNLFFATKFFDTLDFGVGPLVSAGSADIALVKLDPTGKTLWSHRYGGHGNDADQIPGKIVVTKSGLIALSGTFTGTLTLKDTIVNTGIELIDFLGAVDAEGKGLWAKSCDTQGGALQSLASSPAEDSFAVCGYTLGAATDLVPGASVADDGLEDILLAKIDALTGEVLWSRQIGGVGSQLCTSVAMDETGDVYAAGLYNGTLDLGRGALSLVPQSKARAIWVAKFDSATGVTKNNSAWGNDLKQVLANMTLDSARNVILVGSMRGTLNVGDHSLTTVVSGPGADAGTTVARSTTDAFVIKLDSNLTPLWARSWGDAFGRNQEARSVAILSNGDLLVTGVMRGTIDVGGGIPPMTVATGADFYQNPQTDPFWIRLRSDNGTSLCAQHYGDQYGQSADIVVTRPSGTVTDAIVIGGFQGSIDFGLGTFVAPGIGNSMPKTMSYVLHLAGL